MGAGKAKTKLLLLALVNLID